MNYDDIIFDKKWLINHSPFYQEYNLTLKQFIEEVIDRNNFNPPYLKYPNYQKEINIDKVNEMIVSYKKNPEFFNYKNKLVFSFVPSTQNLYIMDGQHRIELIKNLVLNNYNNCIILCIYIIDNEEKNISLFDDLNKDSYKNSTYVNLDDFSKELHLKLKEYFNKYALYFDKKEKKDSYKMTLSNFLEKIENSNYLLNFTNINDIINDIEKSNQYFNNCIGYLEYYNDNPKLFYKDEQDCVKNGIIFSLTNNNFIDYLINKNVKPEHKFKKDKKRISSSLKRKVWEKEYGNANNGRCPYKKCVNTIYKNNYSCGHIISEYNDGKTDISNLRPMCHGCNNKLGKRNWT